MDAFGRQGRQAGLGLIETLLLTLLVGGALTAGFVWLLVDTPAEQVAEQERVLDMADRAIEAFVSVNHRLPCADTDDDGRENCAGGARGSLPWRDLRVEDSGMRERLSGLAYEVAADDLLAATDRFDPAELGTVEYRQVDQASRFGLPSSGADYQDYDHVTSLDFCVGLSEVGGGATQPVYAIAHPGVRDRDGSGSLFDGPNADGSGLASSSRAADADYDDRVRERGREDLAVSLDCATLGISVDALSLASTAVAEVHDQQKWLIANASIAAVTNVIQVVVGGVKIVIAAKNIAAAVVELSAASVALSAAIASCVVIVGCAEIPHAAAWVAASSVAVAAGAASIAANVAAMALNTGAFATNLSVAVEMGVDLGDVNRENDAIDKLGVDMLDLSTLIDTDTAREALQDQLDDANETVDELEGDEADAFSERQDACSCGSDSNCREYVDERNWGLDAYLDDDMRSIVNEVRGETDSTSISLGDIDELRRRAGENLEDQRALEAAIENRDNAEKSDDYGDSDEAQEAEGASGEAYDDIISELDADVEATESELAGADDDEREQLEAELDALRETRGQIESGASGTAADEQVEEIDTAIADINDEIASIDDRIDDAGDNSDLLSQLEERRAELEASRDDLQTQRNRVSPDADALDAQVDQAQSDLEASKGHYDYWRNRVIEDAKGTYEEEYTEEECTGSGDDEECKDVTKTREKEFDRQDEMRDAIDEYFQAKDERPEDDPDDADSDYEACYTADRKWREARTALDTAREQREQAQQSADLFEDPTLDYDDNPAVKLWDDTNAILEEADRRGGNR
ncbi:MAG: hypothetical protein LC667_00290 [Thioalkalivibrio sp.]|nr:hypothetical protein [Thioalkalivibrio sp.]